MTYSFDNYTNEGLEATLAINPGVIVEFGINVAKYRNKGGQMWEKRSPNPQS